MEVASHGSLLNRSNWLRLALLLLFVAFAGGIAQAQSTASVNGTVTDPTGAAVPNAKVTITNEATGVATNTVTDAAGAYLFPALPIGTYRIDVTATNFQAAVIKDLKLQVATSVTENVQLKVGEATEKVEIVADAAVIETTTNSMGQVINDKTVQDIPLNGRHFTDLSLLTPGTVTPPANGFLSFPLRGQGSFGINTAGQREDTTDWLVNGINLNDNVQNQITFQPPIDTLAEYKIDNSTFPAQYGRNAGAIVNLATRSGTNEFHGEAFEFFRNSYLDARNYFNPIPQPQSSFKRNEFGADLGGPIIKNKLFFFLAYESIRQHQGLTVGSTVPDQNQRAAVTPGSAVAKLLALVPAANQVGGGNPADPTTFNFFSGPALANVDLNQGSADVDYELSTTDRVHGYWVVQRDLRQEPTAGTNLPNFGDTRSGLRQLLTVSEDHTFSPSLTNTIRLGFNRIHLTFTPNNADSAANFGINLPSGVPSGALPNIIIAGAMAFGGPGGEPQGRGDTTGVLNDSLSWLVGRHTFEFGGEIRRAYNNNISENIGSFSFGTLNSFLSDSASRFTTQLGAGNDKIVAPAYAGYAQDSFKWRPNVTLNVGLRYEWNSTPFEGRSRFTNFDAANGTLIPAAQPYGTSNKNFEPRVGFAWDPFKDGKTSVRGAYAILTQAPTTNILTGLSGNPPFAIPESITTGVITLENPTAFITGISLGPTAIAPNFKNMYAQDWNLGVQRQITSTLGVSVTYVGTKGTHLQLTQNINQPFVTNGVYGSVHPYLVLPNTSPVFPSQCPCSFGTINLINSTGNSNYNALWVTANKHFSRGFEFLASYTFSHSYDYNSLSTGETIGLQNAYDPRADYGPSEFDVRNRVVVSGFYQLPFKGNRLKEGWQLGVITQGQSGSPINPTLTIQPGVSLVVRPDVTGAVQVTGNPQQWFANKAVFSTPCLPIVPPATLPVCHPGDLKRDSIVGPDFVNTDFSVTKDTKIWEQFNLQFRAEMFDVFNHPNFGNPVLNVTSGSFGNIQSTRFPTGDFGSSRQIQFALKLTF
ncbi:MAG TPA: TonB-dependent receptor [Candidatus Acidoferrum sp.]|nr:TonB-dependent receptor [Candidatus Acidoferrum sp.]